MMELRECPMCGGKAEFLEVERSTYRYAAGCARCGVYTNGSAFKNDEYNAKAWNTRHDDWQDISLGAKDGTYIIAYYPDEEPSCQVTTWTRGGWKIAGEGAWISPDSYPTHFRHLPKAPGDGR